MVFVDCDGATNLIKLASRRTHAPTYYYRRRFRKKKITGFSSSCTTVHTERQAVAVRSVYAARYTTDGQREKK